MLSEIEALSFFFPYMIGLYQSKALFPLNLPALTSFSGYSGGSLLREARSLGQIKEKSLG